MRFITTTTGIGKTSTGAGFGGKSPKTPEEQVDTLLQLLKNAATRWGSHRLTGGFGRTIRPLVLRFRQSTRRSR